MVSGFLFADADDVARRRKEIALRAASRPAIGIAWRSSNAAYGAQKSLKLNDLAPLLGRQDVFWVDLQYGDTEAERRALQAETGTGLWRDPTVDPLQDMDAAAAQITALDLVISTSNTAVHMTGALGVPTWLLLPAPGFGLLWYWFLGRPDSPFYPSVRCFRQSVAGEWGPVVTELGAALAVWLENRA